MDRELEFDRRTALRTIGTGVLGGVVLTGPVSADTDSGPILLEDTSFNPLTYHTEPDNTVTWEHADTTFEGMVHNVHIHEHENEGNRLMSSGALELGDTYDVSFDLINGSTLRVSDENQTKDIAVDGRPDIEFGVHCDFHAGPANIEGTMKMEEFLVHL